MVRTETLYAEALSALHAELGALFLSSAFARGNAFQLRWAQGISSPPPDSLGRQSDIGLSYSIVLSAKSALHRGFLCHFDESLHFSISNESLYQY